ncbi:uncharacterized protein LOC143275632 [Babylonia areolata]|uniref:uncharacterized protein LOC143275632 n=1 Tax=Babylonia areolata TaxID=304850 RepID=UPI003FD46076
MWGVVNLCATTACLLLLGPRVAFGLFFEVPQPRQHDRLRQVPHFRQPRSPDMREMKMKMKYGGLHGLEGLGNPPEAFYPEEVGPWTVDKRPLDTVGSGFVKKEVEEPMEAEDVSFHPQMPERRPHDKRSAIELIKKGLDVLGSGLFKKKAHEDTTGFPQIKEALDQLSKGLGNGDPGKSVDVDIVRRGLDRLGAGLLKRGLDTEGIGFIKRGIHNLASGLAEKVPEDFLEEEGLGLLRKGLDYLSFVLTKNGFDPDGVDMVTKGVLNLATTVITRSRPQTKLPEMMDDDDEKEEEEEKQNPYGKEHYDLLFGPHSKKSLDVLGTELMKKASDKWEEDATPGPEHTIRWEKKHGLDEIGSGFIKKDLDYVGSGLIKKDVHHPAFAKDLGTPDPNRSEDQQTPSP